MSATKPALWKQVRIRQTDEGGEMKISFQRATRLRQSILQKAFTGGLV